MGAVNDDRVRIHVGDAGGCAATEARLGSFACTAVDTQSGRYRYRVDVGVEATFEVDFICPAHEIRWGQHKRWTW